MSSLYDPLGFVALVILTVKAILRNLCQQGMSWDQAAPSDDRLWWSTWLRDLPVMMDLSVDRCFLPSGHLEGNSVEVHHFTDASGQGYAAVAYLHFVGTFSA